MLFVALSLVFSGAIGGSISRTSPDETTAQAT
eukprot:COSAG06_NODE_26502_length_613_cov_1.295720_2_plen_31_part_01